MDAINYVGGINLLRRGGGSESRNIDVVNDDDDDDDKPIRHLCKLSYRRACLCVCLTSRGSLRSRTVVYGCNNGLSTL